MRDQTEHRRDLLKSVAFAVFILVILWLRRPDSLLNAQFWAEDGGAFFREQLMFGFWSSLVRPYSGYIHFFPRVFTAVMSMLPVRWVPLGCNAITLLMEAICCSAFSWPCYRRIIPSDALRLTCCVVLASTIVAGSELIGTLSNVQWYLCILSLLVIMVTVRGQRGEIGLTLLQVSIAFTAPVTLLYSPFLISQLKNNPSRLRWRPAIHLAALSVQGLIMRAGSLTPKPALRFDSLFVAIVGSGLSRCVLAPLLGWRFSRDYTDVALFTALALALAGVVALATVMTIKAQNTEQLKWFWSAVYVCLGSLLATLWGRALIKPFLTMQGLRDYAAERYFLIGACLFIFCLALTIDTLTRTDRQIFGAAILAAIFAFGTFRNFSAPAFVDLNWKQSADKIEKWKGARKRHEHVESLAIPINPPIHNMILD